MSPPPVDTVMTFLAPWVDGIVWFRLPPSVLSVASPPPRFMVSFPSGIGMAALTG